MIVTPLTVDRALRIMDSLIKALEKRGFQVIVEPSESTYLTHVVILGEKIPIKIEEIQSGTPGRLALWFWKIWGEGLDKETRDIRQYRLEEMLNSFLCRLIDTAGRQWIIHQQKHQKEHELQEIENCRLAKERKHKEEQERIDALVKEANLYDSYQKIKAYVLAVKKASINNAGQIPEGSPLTEWIQWATQIADHNDPVKRRIERLQNCTDGSSKAFT